MPRLGDILGQERAVSVLREGVESGRVHHAYLFTGPAHSGKFATARAFAAALNCETAPAEGCDQCAVCTRIEEDRHPDIIHLEPRGAANMIPIDAIREQVVPALALPPHEARARVFLIEEATRLAGPAANALLKSLEEPPPRTHFILCTTAPDRLLPTIRSRCQRIAFAPLDTDVAQRLYGASEDESTVTQSVDALMEAAHQTGLGTVLDAAQKVAAHKDDVADILVGFAQALSGRARLELASGEPRRAAGYARWAGFALDSEVGVSMHNANKQLALEELLVKVRRAPLPPKNG